MLVNMLDSKSEVLLVATGGCRDNSYLTKYWTYSILNSFVIIARVREAQRFLTTLQAKAVYSITQNPWINGKMKKEDKLLRKMEVDSQTTPGMEQGWWRHESQSADVETTRAGRSGRMAEFCFFPEA